ncbi:ATPase [Bacillus coahuilensis p1.1.43]|uniref:P-type Ca(2+) transporter n=1 Tax=Bacillus coahuilensis p1.1.43 TaxID=1150625 RepID=A0A147K9I2_9BACI|nr:calcium-translocating P-type ATPase, SERCA-type [Bacillus coahuilensis]KUP07054.1 ATPase [Bacillus coahuilensis p1.1.43]
MNFHSMEEREIEAGLDTDLQGGLSSGLIEQRQKKVGYNELEEEEKQSAILLFFSQFKDFMVLILLAATLISGLLGEYIDAIAIIAIVLVNGILGFYQERKAERSLQALKQLSAPQVMALRNGKWTRIPSREVVPGDVLKFEAGDRIGADVRLIHTSNLEIEESALTGESMPVQKNTTPIKEGNINLGDMHNMAFMGTLVTRGNGVGVVTQIGMKTAMGQIANLLQTAETMETPLQRRLDQLGKILIVGALLLTLLVVLLGVLQGQDLYTMFLAGVSLAVAAIPEGLPAIVTVALSLGVQRMIKQKAIVRKLPAVETLGCASVICSDKTGTLTQNKMTVTTIWTSGKSYTVSGNGYEPEGNFYEGEEKFAPSDHINIQRLLQYGMICNHASIHYQDDHYVLEGDPTEGAMMVAAMKAGFRKPNVLKEYKILKEFPFDSSRKMMSMIVEHRGKRLLVTKGAPDVLIQKSDSILWDGKKKFLSKSDEVEVNLMIERLGSQALRTIAVAYREIHESAKEYTEDEVEKDFTFIGLQGMMDPPRQEVEGAIKECKEAGIKTVMITGDHMITAKAIARNLGILHDGDRVMDGKSLSLLDKNELDEMIEDITVFARVTPEHKLTIVKSLQRKGHIVAMTGDGVNDAPAIKSADIGIAMGITGTDVAKEASSLVLMDDHFATIKTAIMEGRNIYENIRKFIRYLLASNVGEILVMLFAMLLALPLPLVPIQILWVNLVTDGLPAMALGLDQPEGNVMKQKPRHPREGVFARGLGWKVISRGFLIGVVTLAAFMLAYSKYPDQLIYAQTVAFATLVTAQLIHVFDCRSEVSVLSRNPFENKYLVWAVVSSFVLMFVVIYTPFLQPIFHTVPIKLMDWLMIIGLSSLPTFLLAGSFFAGKKKETMV